MTKMRIRKTDSSIGTRATKKGIDNFLRAEKKKKKYKNQGLELFTTIIPNSKNYRKDERGKYGLFARKKPSKEVTQQRKNQQITFNANQKKRDINKIRNELRKDGIYIKIRQVIPSRYLNTKKYNPKGIKLNQSDKKRIKEKGY